MTEQRTMTARSWAEMGLLGLIWGGSFLANRVTLEEVAVATAVALRVTGAAVALWAVVLLQGAPVPRRPGAWGAFLVMGLLGSALPFSLIVWGQQSIESGLAAILNASTAILGVLVAAVAFRDERLTPRKLAGLGVGFLGVVTVIGPSALHEFDITSLAQLSILGASLSYALAGSFGRIAARGIEPLVSAAGMLSGAAVVMGPAALLQDGWPVAAGWSWRSWAALGYLAFVASALAYLIFYRLLRRTGAGNTTLVTLLVAPVAIVLGAIAFGEQLPWRAYAGFAFLALGLTILDGRLGRRRSGDGAVGDSTA